MRGHNKILFDPGLIEEREQINIYKNKDFFIYRGTETNQQHKVYVFMSSQIIHPPFKNGSTYMHLCTTQHSNLALANLGCSAQALTLQITTEKWPQVQVTAHCRLREETGGTWSREQIEHTHTHEQEHTTYTNS